MPRLPLPEGHHTVTPACQVPNAAAVIEFLEQAFDGKVVERYDGPGGSIMHAEVRLGDAVLMLGDPVPDGAPMPAALSYYVEDGPAVDATYRRALECGARSRSEPADQFYGYRNAQVEDAGGNHWTICAVVERLTPDEIQRRMAELMDG